MVIGIRARPGRPPATAMTTIRTYASRLRTVLDPQRAARQAGDLVVTEAGGYALRVPRETLDLATFERFFARRGVTLAPPA